MSSRRSALVMGGGLAGAAAAYTLAASGWQDILIVERGSEIGGLAGTFKRGNSFYPLAYHHILHKDRSLLYFLDQIGMLESVRWRKVDLLFHLDGRFYNLARPLDFARFPMSFPDKLRFVHLMLRSFSKDDWSDWFGRSAAELVDKWASKGVREVLFEPLSRLKFDLPCSEVSAAWLGARLHFREGSSPLGYIPGENWTKVLCDGLLQLLQSSGVRIQTQTEVTRLSGRNGRIVEAELSSGERVSAEAFVSALPTPVYMRITPEDQTPHLSETRYSAVVSAILATRQSIEPDFYWLNLASLDFNACGLFMLDSLNPTIGDSGDSVLNFVTHLPSSDHALFRREDEEWIRHYSDDFRRLFGFDLDPFWAKVTRIPLYSPVFGVDYRNPPVRSTTWENIYFAGNYRTFPSIASTGTALGSGVESAAEILADSGVRAKIVEDLACFQPPARIQAA